MIATFSLSGMCPLLMLLGTEARYPFHLFQELWPCTILVVPHTVDLRAPCFHALKEFRNVNKIMVPHLERNTPPRRFRHS